MATKTKDTAPVSARQDDPAARRAGAGDAAPPRLRGNRKSRHPSQRLMRYKRRRGPGDRVE